MKIKTKWHSKIIVVDVSYDDCDKKCCFYPHKFQHYSTNGVGKGYTKNGQDDYFSCGTRNYHSCPENPRYCSKEKLNNRKSK